MQQELKTQILRGEFYWEAIESNLSYIRPSDFISKCWSKIHFTQDLGLVLLFPEWPNIFDKMVEVLLGFDPSQKAAAPWSLFGI